MQVQFVHYMMHGLKILGRKISIWARCWRSFAIWRACSWYVCYSLHNLSCAKISHCQTDFLDLATWMQPTVLFLLWDKMLQTGISSNPQVHNFHELNPKNFKIYKILLESKNNISSWCQSAFHRWAEPITSRNIIYVSFIVIWMMLKMYRKGELLFMYTLSWNRDDDERTKN
jgi:hypothetical protein